MLRLTDQRPYAEQQFELMFDIRPLPMIVPCSFADAINANAETDQAIRLAWRNYVEAFCKSAELDFMGYRKG